VVNLGTKFRQHHFPSRAFTGDKKLPVEVLDRTAVGLLLGCQSWQLPWTDMPGEAGYTKQAKPGVR